MSNKFVISFSQIKSIIPNVEAIDYFFAKEMLNLFIDDLTEKEQQSLLYLCVALSESLRQGHVCLPVESVAGIKYGLLEDDQKESIQKESVQENSAQKKDTQEKNATEINSQGYQFISKQSLIDLLSALNITEDHFQPLVLKNNLLYMRRYFQFESALQSNISSRLQDSKITALADNKEYLTLIKSCINSVFPKAEASLSNNDINTIIDTDWQKVAVTNAINKSFSVIAGGPGTGKTYTVTKLLATLLMLNKALNKELDNTLNKQSTSSIQLLDNIVRKQALKIALVAPTGKAAQRLSESITQAVLGFENEIPSEILAEIPTEAQTIHRLLGVIPNQPNFKHNKDNQLTFDVVIVDEVSMVDLPLMTRLMNALKATCKVILLGDADQLPSVATGSVLADLAPKFHTGYSDKNQAYISTVASENITFPIEITDKTNKPCDYLTYLYKSRRFDGKGGIGLLATAVIAGEPRISWQLLTQSKEPSNQLTLHSHSLDSWLPSLVQKYYEVLFACNDIQVAFELLAKFRILCATRQGEHSVDSINQWIIEYFVHNKLIEVNKPLFQSLPIMIAENDYRLGLFNGDIGLLWKNNAGQLMAVFEAKHQGEFKWIIPSRLPKYETVYAMTIHKTQGSEFEHVAMVLPKQDNLLLSRELLYTGITRAKKQLTLACSEHIWLHSVKNTIKRFSGFSL